MIITVRDAANLLNVTQKTVNNWIKENKIPFHRVGEQYFFERFELFQFAVNERLNPVAVFADDEENGEKCAFYESLVRGGIFYNVGGTTKKEVLYNSLKLIKGIDQTSIEPLFEMFMVREELASTGIGDGIAIPHSRGPLIGYVNYPLISLSFTENPIDYGALDGKPVKVLFLIVSPTIRIHLQLLGRLAFALNLSECREAVMRRENPEKILALFKDAESRCQDIRKGNG